MLTWDYSDHYDTGSGLEIHLRHRTGRRGVFSNRARRMMDQFNFIWLFILCVILLAICSRLVVRCNCM